MDKGKTLVELFDEVLNESGSEFYSKVLKVFEFITSDPEPDVPDEFFTNMDQATRKVFITAFCVFIRKDNESPSYYEDLIGLAGRAQLEKQGML
jgi:hypothetical protein